MCRTQCGYCEKLVKDKFIFGTLHICLSPEEKIAKTISMLGSQYEPTYLGTIGNIADLMKIKQQGE